MDQSKKYIEMCEKAEEIQKQKPKKGDFYAWPERNGEKEVDVLHEMLMEVLFGDSIYNETVATWLPRQDQLQEMMNQEFHQLLDDFWSEFLEWEWFHRPEWSKDCNSMEQLWLAFVMKEKYNKIWNGKEWVK